MQTLMLPLLTAAAGEEGHAELNPLIPHPVEIILSRLVFGLMYWLVIANGGDVSLPTDAPPPRKLFARPLPWNPVTGP